MQLGIRLHDMADAPLETRLAEAAEQGFACGHLALSKVLPETPSDAGALTPGYAMYLRRLFAANGLDVAVLGCYLNLAEPDETELAKIQSRYFSHIRFASVLGAGVVGTETGEVDGAYRYGKKNHSEEALAIFLENLRPVVACAQKAGVILAIEPVYKHIVWNPVTARRVLDEINSPNLQIIFDPVNLLDISNYRERDAVFEEALALLGDEIAVVHLKDFVIRDGAPAPAAAGTGEMDYTRILSFIKERKPFIHVTLENTRPGNAQAARAYIQGIWENL